MENNKGNRVLGALILGASLGLGISSAGHSIGNSFYLAHTLNRIVNVKGLAERNVVADLGIWEIDYREVGGSLNDINQRIQHDQTLVTAFLKQHGFQDAELEVQPIRLEDKVANAYQRDTAIAADQRYLITGGMRVRSIHVDLIQQVNQLTGTLLQQGVPLAFDISNITPNPSYYFTKLDEIRPAMLADATKSARLVAEQFAKDSGTALDGIQHANQGIFQITSRDSSEDGGGAGSLGTIDKKVRLVTTIDYRLR